MPRLLLPSNQVPSAKRMPENAPKLRSELSSCCVGFVGSLPVTTETGIGVFFTQKSKYSARARSNRPPAPGAA